MTIRLLDFGQVDSLRSLAIFHGVGYAMREDTPDTITITRPLDPFVSIDIHSQVPGTHAVDIEPGQQRKIPNNHKPLNVVGIAQIEGLAQGPLQAAHVRLGIPEKIWQGAFGIESITLGVLGH